MENKNQYLTSAPPAGAATPTENPQPIQPPSQNSSRMVIHPINDMSEYVSSQPARPSQPTQPAPATESAEPTESHPSANDQPAPAAVWSTDASKIYPDAPTRPAPNASAAPESITPGPALRQAGKPGAPVASYVGSLKVYAILIMANSLYACYTYLSGYLASRAIRSSASPDVIFTHSNLWTPLAFYIFGVALFSVLVGVYFLLAKNIKTISAILTVLLIIGGIGLLNTIVSLFRYGSANVHTIISLLISAGLFWYLLTVKSHVDDAAAA